MIIEDLVNKIERDRAAISQMDPVDILKATKILGHPPQPGDIFYVGNVLMGISDEGVLNER